MLHATIMAGGSGTRFWPASRRQLPKQLLRLVDEQSMLQGTVARLNGLCENDQILILTNQRLVEATEESVAVFRSRLHYWRAVQAGYRALHRCRRWNDRGP